MLTVTELPARSAAITPRQGLDTGAGRAVRHEAPADHGLLVHRDVDDPTAAGAEHQRHHLASHQEAADQLGLHDVPEAGRPDLPEGLRYGQEAGVDRPHTDARVVDEHVEAAPRAAGPVDTSRDRALVPHVELAGDGPGAELGGGGFGPGPVAAGDHHLGARPDQRGRHCRAEAAAGAGDQDAEAVQIDGRGLDHEPTMPAILPCVDLPLLM
jgi:hypothetical protein